MIYFDHNATTPIDEAVLEAMLPFLERFYGNPSSLYRLGRLAKSAVESAREQVAALVGVSPNQVVFTSGGTEANNLALAQINKTALCAISAIEHPSLKQPAARLFPKLLTLPVDSQGSLAADAALNMALKANDFVSVMLANNETGVIQDVAAVFDKLRARGVICHSDVVQACGKIPVDFDALQAQLISLSSHKLYGPKGCGALIFERGFPLKPLLLGGGQEQGIRAGTENVAAIVGFGRAAEMAKSDLLARQQKLLKLRQALETQLHQIPGCVIFSDQAERLPNTVQFSLDGIDGEMLLMQLDQHNIAVSSGSACASGGGEPSPVLVAMGIDMDLARAAIRVSFGKDNELAEIDQFITIVKKIVGV
jgi:cysteine desulfurase